MKQFISSKTYSELWKVLEIKTEVRKKIPEDVLKHIKFNGNIDLILDKFVIEMRDCYE